MAGSEVGHCLVVISKKARRYPGEMMSDEWNDADFLRQCAFKSRGSHPRVRHVCGTHIPAGVQSIQIGD